MTTFEAEGNGTKALASAIILRAVLDYDALKPDDAKKRKELDEFFSSGWFYGLCDLCGLEPHGIRQKLAAGDYKIPASVFVAAADERGTEASF